MKETFNALGTRGVLDNTYAFCLSDNGLGFGSHRWNGKGCVEECIHVRS